jgi:hypothetical protein
VCHEPSAISRQLTAERLRSISFPTILLSLRVVV